MAEFYTSAHVIKFKRKGRDAWQGVLRYQVPNPEYVEDTREPNQRRKSFGKKPNPDYVPDERTANQRKANIQKDVRKVFDPDEVRTKSQATTALVKWRKQMEAEHGAPDASLTVEKYVERYIDGREKKATVSKSTIKDYRGTSRYFKYGDDKAIANVILRDLTPAQIDAWESALLEHGLSGTTALKAHRLIKQVCKYAFEIGDIQVTPVRGFKAPRRSTGKPNALDAEGRRQIMLKLGELKQDPVAIAAMAALYTGMRRGEICALTWSNVDLEGVTWQDANDSGPKIRVVQSFGEGQGGAFLKLPKTASGRRIVPISGGLLDVLKERRASMWHDFCEKMQSAEVIPTEGMFSKLYVIGDVSGDYCSPNTLTHQWTQLSKQLDIKGTEDHRVTLHDLRHTYATSAITRGADVSSVSANLGHAQVSTTLNMYTSRDSAAQRAASDTVARDLDSARTGDVIAFSRNGTEG